MIGAFIACLVAIVGAAGFVGAAAVYRDVTAAVFFSCVLVLGLVVIAMLYGAAVLP
ncbi:hypothetical protein [Microbacterium sp. SL75]|uniref:hypothetical protein n=1 Tax=Microbacterium sp. SL75 TaxID=2995140 RepID=UPI00226FF21C|nr:hypothetical protein [Microbacterium sp. SL75]WAC68877.1 hypothetical protein OVA17_15015 [Microbacterium sp. SL75]